jgi:DNA-binding transcriptional ArsR family regulator
MKSDLTKSDLTKSGKINSGKIKRDLVSAAVLSPPSDLANVVGTISPELDQMMQNARRASDYLKALSHENRLLLLCLMAEQERSVGELENLLSMRQSAVSQQLARLRLDGLVTTRREGKSVLYRLANDDIRRLIGVIYDIFCGGHADAGKQTNA